ncbi:TPA: hypothetical protein DEF17_03190, partial [bacterium]|nr:MAG: hypothetical protein AUJ18_10890 [Candidatus Hydrogenedentes bacterium CG1_02_42_14]HBW46924.1 hypothetical protein [bacterium]
MGRDLKRCHIDTFEQFKNFINRFIFLSIFLLGFLLSACSDSNSKTIQETQNPEANLMNTFFSMTQCIEREDSFSFLDFVSDRYVPSRDMMKMNIDNGLNEFYGYSYTLLSQRINVENEEGVIVINWRRGRANRSSGEHEVTDGITELKFTLENGNWKLIQQNGDELF